LNKDTNAHKVVFVVLSSITKTAE